MLLWPLSAKALHGQKAVQDLQPDIQALKKRYGKNKQEFNKAVMELYKEKGVNPFGSCAPTLFQLPFLLGMFYTFLMFRDPTFVSLADPNSGITAMLYEPVKNLPQVSTLLSAGGSINTMFLGVIDLATRSIPLALIASALQFVQTKMLTPHKNKDQAQQAMSQMTYIFPVITFFFALSLPAALPLYWTVHSGFSIFQQYYIMHRDVTFLEHLKSSVKKNKAKS